MYIQKKFWKHVEDRLLDIENTGAYFTGATLSLPLGVDSTGKKRGICLNLNGKGFVLSNIKNTSVYVPEDITDLVRDIYNKTKSASKQD